jgi:cytochrome c5
MTTINAISRVASPLATPLLGCLLMVLAACGRGEDRQTVAPTAAPVAADPAIQKIYDVSCKTCHSNPGSGAPLAGDAKAWAPRLTQGRDALLGHTINGYKAMPPMGLCMQCSEQDFAALIEYMSGAKLP